jgi:peptidoglycan/LPS O-acetylase OafA/YrhL
LQWPVYQFLNEMNEKHVHMSAPYLFNIALIVLLLFAALSYHVMELPLKRIITAIKAR